MRRTPLVVIALLAAVGVAACGSSSTTASTTTSPTSPTTSAAAPTSSSAASQVPITVVAAASVPAVTGPQGTKPGIAKPTAPAPTTVLSHDVITGTGTAVTVGSTVSVNYTLALYATGAPVQSSYDTGSPFSFTVGAGMSIPGFDQGVVGMKPGGRRELIIPPVYGYGDEAQDGIPANSTLIFVVDLVSVG